MNIVVVNKDAIAAAHADSISCGGSAGGPAWSNFGILNGNVRGVGNSDAIPRRGDDVKMTDHSAILAVDGEGAGCLLTPAVCRCEHDEGDDLRLGSIH